MSVWSCRLLCLQSPESLRIPIGLLRERREKNYCEGRLLALPPHGLHPYYLLPSCVEVRSMMRRSKKEPIIDHSASARLLRLRAREDAKDGAARDAKLPCDVVHGLLLAMETQDALVALAGDELADAPGLVVAAADEGATEAARVEVAAAVGVVGVLGQRVAA
jgi:hypothetical protein